MVLGRPAAFARGQSPLERPLHLADELGRAKRAPGMGRAADSLGFSVLVRRVDEEILPRGRGPCGAPKIQMEQGVAVGAAAMRRGAGPRMVLGQRHHAGAHGVALDIAESHPRRQKPVTDGTFHSNSTHSNEVTFRLSPVFSVMEGVLT